jgi:hypothetical protein
MKLSYFTKITFIILMSLLLLSFVGVQDDIDNALKTGDYKFLGNNMNETVELVILEKENVYSKTQAEQILKNFFISHKPTGFEILHKGGGEKSKYFIGTLKTSRKSFRVYYLLKTKNEKSLIYQLRIESDE